MIHAPPAACLTTTEAHRYVSSRALFEYLEAECGLKQLYRGRSGKKILYAVSEIDTALTILRLNGGWDEDTGKPIQ